MRQRILIALLCGGTLALSGCGGGWRTDVARAVDGAAADGTEEIERLMLTAAPPDEAIPYFQRRMRDAPDDIAPGRGLATSLTRAGRAQEALLAWRRVAGHPDATDDDRVSLAAALVRADDWTGAKAQLDAIPPTHATFERYRIEAMIADSLQDWAKADAFYDTAIGLTTTPASVLNNWGFSKLTRGDLGEAERLFTEAITYDRELFTAKNNLVLARAKRRLYALPAVPATQEEQAQLMHTAALAAIRQGDTDIGRNLLEEAIDTHPRHFEAATRALDALNA